MAAPIVYEGVESQGGGHLFQGMKFWVAQRVPLRKTYIDMIQQNGGSIVPLEKNADMLIADHMRKNAPPGSYSWKWIEDSVKQGTLQSKDSDMYLIGRAPQESRAVASAEPGKGTRTPFTPADDSQLIKWVLSRSDKEKGNKIYQDLELINNRHTFQSWRDRWVKKLSFLSQEDLKKRVIESPPPPQREEHDSPAPGQPEEPSVPQPEMEDQQARNQLAELASHWPRGQWWHPEHPPQQPVHQRTTYCMLRITRYVLVAGDRLEDIWKDDGILLRLVKTKGAGVLTRDVAEAALKEIKANYRSQIEPAEGSSVDTPAVPSSPVNLPPLPTAAQVGQRRHPANAPTPKPTRVIAQSSPRRIRYTAEQDLRLAQSIEHAARTGTQAGTKWFHDFAAQNPEHTWQSWRDHWVKVLRPRIETAESHGREYGFHEPYSKTSSGIRDPSSRLLRSSADQRRVARQRTVSPDTAEGVIELGVEQNEKSSAEQEDRRKQFFVDMAAYLEIMERDSDLQPRVYRQVVDLYQLYEAAKASRSHADEVDWGKVAEKLSFGRNQYPNAPKLLRKCYENSLQDFVRTLEEDDDLITEDEEEGNVTAEDDEPGQDTSDPGAAHEGATGASPSQNALPPGSGAATTSRDAHHRHSFGVKRTRAVDGGLGLPTHNISGSKRQRRNREDEIPSTPEGVLGFTSGAAGSDMSSSLVFKTSRAGPSTREEVHDSQDSADFEVTPSQQLHQEEQLTTPIPLQLPIRDSTNVRPRARGPDKNTAGWDFTLGATSERENNIQQWSVNVSEAHQQGDDGQPQPDTDQDADEVAKKVEYYESFGYSRKIVCQALTATCMETGIASEVMEMLRKHPNQGLPNNMMGVWTSKDDEGLKFTCGEPSPDPVIERNRAYNVARERKRLEYKHGRDRITTRIDFLAITWYEAKRKRMKTMSIP